MRDGARCTADNALEGDGGAGPVEGDGRDAAPAAEGADAGAPDTRPEPDAGHDAGRDAAPVDAGMDAGGDASVDAGVDAGADAALDAATDAAVDASVDACTDCGPCDAGYVREAGVCVRNPCLATVAEPALCDAHASCTYRGAGDADCECDPLYLGDGLTCVRNQCIPDAGAAAPCGASASCAPAADGSPVCTCAPGFADCDATFVNGCEVKLDADPDHCGACAHACASGLDCNVGVCEQRVKHIGLGMFTTMFTTPGGVLLGAGNGLGLVNASTPTAMTHGPIASAYPYYEHACALHPGGIGADCWGKNNAKQLGSTDTMATSFAITDAALALCTGNNHSCMVGSDGRPFCWGSGLSGEYGDGVTRDRAWTGRGYVAAKVAPADNVYDTAQLGCGDDLNCSLNGSGEVQCWGLGSSGAYKPEVVRDATLAPLNDAVALSVGNKHACAIRGDATLVCWGNSDDGRLGAGSTLPAGRNLHVKVSLSGVASVACGSAHTCALLRDGTVRCWGNGGNGQLGRGDTVTRATPSEPLLPAGYVATGIYTGPQASHTCVTLTTGQVYCWGYNYYGQLGVGGPASPYEATPREVTSWP